MQKKKWVRVGLATVIAGSALIGMSAAGCSGDDNTTPTGGDSGTHNDSSVGTDTGTSNNDTGTSNDTGVMMEAAPPPVNAKVYLVHAVTDPLAPPFRFCFGVGAPDGGSGVTIADSIPPFPDTKESPAFQIAGLYPGFGGSVASSPKLAGFDLSTLEISLYAIDATKIANDTADGGPDGGPEVVCEGLIGTDALGKGGGGGGTLTLGTDYFYTGTIQAGVLAHGTTWAVAVTGCFPGEPGPSEEGGAGSALCNNKNLGTYSPTTGNMQLSVFQVDNKTVVTAGDVGAQFANASPAWDVETAGDVPSSTTAAGYWSVTVPSSDGGTDAGDAEAGPVEPQFGFFPVTTTGAFGTITPATMSSTPGIPLNASNGGFGTGIFTSGTVAQVPPGCTPGACLSPFVIPMPDIDELTNGATVDPDSGIVTTPAGGSYATGKGYVFMLIGDPNQPETVGGQFNPKFAHFLAFPAANP